MPEPVVVGQPAPDFTLPDQDGRPVSLSDLAGRTVVLYFYPEAGTRGCTVQACGVRDRSPDYEAAGAVVVGVSPDPVAKVRQFADSERLGFTLLADADHSVAERYGVWGRWGGRVRRGPLGVRRATFVIGADGRVTHVFERVDPVTHDEIVLRALTGS